MPANAAAMTTGPIALQCPTGRLSAPVGALSIPPGASVAPGDKRKQPRGNLLAEQLLDRGDGRAAGAESTCGSAAHPTARHRCSRASGDDRACNACEAPAVSWLRPDPDRDPQLVEHTARLALDELVGNCSTGRDREQLVDE